jgi:uncharacterized protein
MTPILPSSTASSFVALTTNFYRNRSPWEFLFLVFILTVPFLIVGALKTLQVIPGIPMAALAIVCPVTAALIFVYREKKFAGIKELLKRSFDFKRVRSKIWYVPLVLLMPCIMLLSYVVMGLLGMHLPTPRFKVVNMLVLFVMFFIGALAEELGWSGYVIDPLQSRFGALGGAIILGLVWAVWHWVPLLEVPRSLSFIACYYHLATFSGQGFVL